MSAMIVAFCGVDGSGKTTLSRALKEELTKNGYSAVVIEPFRYTVTEPLLKIFRRTTKRENLGQRKNRLLLFKLWPLGALLDHWIQFLFQIKPLTKKYDYVIADRFFWDFAASFNYFGYTTSWGERLYLRLIPKPDITFVLDLPAEEARQREQGVPHPAEFFVPQRKFYRNLATKHKLEIIDATQESKTVLRTVTGTLSLSNSLKVRSDKPRPFPLNNSL